MRGNVYDGKTVSLMSHQISLAVTTEKIHLFIIKNAFQLQEKQVENVINIFLLLPHMHKGNIHQKH